MKKILITGVLVWGFVFGAEPVLARENVTDWYIKNFDTEIIVNADSSLDITEKITADCGNAPGKHGIFRILPEEIKLTSGEKIKTPIELIGITDFDGQKLKYTRSKNSYDATVTWKIGDPDRTVTGENHYQIHYRVKNAIRFQPNFDELYWNLNGNFWDLETDEFRAKIIFPLEINQENTAVDYYTGSLGAKYKNQAVYRWTEGNVLEFESTGTLVRGDGITASVTFPKNIFTPYQPGFFETYGRYLWFTLPLLAFIYCFRYWWKFGRDPKVDKTVIAEYSPPGNLTPMEMGILDNGSYYDALTTAEIINLAAIGLLTIRETNSKILLFNIKDYVLERKRDSGKESKLITPQKMILDKIFRDGDKTKLSDLKATFPEFLKKVEDAAVRCVGNKNLITLSGEKKMLNFVTAGVLIVIAAFIMFAVSVTNDFSVSGHVSGSLFLSGIIAIVFGVLLRKRTPEGAELAWKIKGFKLFMETVDKHRAKFYEEENIFEKFLPYAIAFEMTDIWIKKMKEIYGEDYFATHAPVWYVGASAASFDADSLTSAINSLSSSISQNTSSSSGSGGGGSSGGGGGGGGGGGW
ncbi:MAG: hypothetical protein QG620_670 [Patescibacteria group bacterium]|nr:hypothetical protein [Patescibacteria group bacterium]